MWGAAIEHDRGTLRLITPPTNPPIALDLARQHLRQDQDFDDAMIGIYLAAAAQSVQDMTGRALMPQVWEYSVSDWPCYGNGIRLPLAPLLSVDAVTADEVVAPTVYRVEVPSGPTCGRGYVYLASGASWPSVEPDTAAITIRFTAGYQNASFVPAPLQAAVLLALGSLYENREAEAEVGGSAARSLAENPAFMRLIRPYQLIG